jgi:hypothetical protein
MKRRDFTKLGLVSALGIPLVMKASKEIEATDRHERTSSNKHKTTVNAYYLRAHMYTLVPRHVREDMKWMADIGTKIVSLAVLEQDLFAAVENIKIICAEAERVGMQVYAVPSRWGGLTAGAPKVPSLFSVRNPHTWILKQDGTPVLSSVSGVISSVHYAETYQLFRDSLDLLFKQFNIAGVIWDEPKGFRTDYSQEAVGKLGKEAPKEAHLKAAADFYGRVSQYVKDKYPDKQVCLFVPANSDQDQIKIAAQINPLDYFGCDGRPWDADEDQKWLGSSVYSESEKGKVLLGKGEQFIRLAKQNGKRALFLIENLNMTKGMIPGMDKGLPRVLEMNPDQIIYYYYPRNIEDPDVNMSVIARNIKVRAAPSG